MESPNQTPQELDPAQIEKKERIEVLKYRYLKIAKAIGAGQFLEHPTFDGQITHGAFGALAGNNIGMGNEHNSPYQSGQLIMALALSHDPRIEEVIQQEKPLPVFKIG